MVTKRESPRSTRNKWTLHPVSLVIALLLIFAVAVRNLDGGPMSVSAIVHAEHPSLTFGWPFVFAVSTWTFTRPVEGEGRFLLLDAGRVNSTPTAVTHVQWSRLIANFVVAVAVFIGAILGIERMVRACRVRFHYSLTSLFALAAFAGSLVWYYRSKPIWNDVYVVSGVSLMCAVGLAWYSLCCIVGRSH